MKTKYKPHLSLFLFGLLITIALLLTLLRNYLSKDNRQIVNGRQVILGAWNGGFWDQNKKSLIPDKLREFENLAGKKMAIAHFYLGWEELASDYSLNSLFMIKDNGWIPMVSINPYFSNKCKGHESNIYKTISVGACDTLIKEISANLKSFNDTLFLRFAWEMNIDTDWGIHKVHSTPEEFIAAWRRFHDIINDDAGNKVIFVFSVNTPKSDSLPYESIYPGSEYVDWVAIDGYNWGNTQSWSSWQTFDAVFAKSYTDLANVAPDKPVMISEVNSAASGGNKAIWFTDMLVNQIPNKYGKVEAIVFFNENKTLKENIDWRIENSPESAEALKNALKNPIYVSDPKKLQ